MLAIESTKPKLNRPNFESQKRNVNCPKFRLQILRLCLCCFATNGPRLAPAVLGFPFMLRSSYYDAHASRDRSTTFRTFNDIVLLRCVLNLPPPLSFYDGCSTATDYCFWTLHHTPFLPELKSTNRLIKMLDDCCTAIANADSLDSNFLQRLNLHLGPK